MASISALRERLRMSLWFIPGVFALAGAVLAIALGALDHELAGGSELPVFAFSGSPEGARNVLSTIAQSMLTFTGLVFSITMLVLQLASGQLSPRVTRTFLRDRGNQAVLGLFVATFVFTLLVLRDVRTPIDGEPFVPAIGVWVAFAMLLASIGAFIWYIDHMAHAIRASTVIASIWEETIAAIDRLYPSEIGAEAPVERELPIPPLVTTVPAEQAGVVVTIDEKRLRQLTSSDDRVLELLPAIGDFVARGEPIARAAGAWSEADVDEVRSAVAMGPERTLEHDARFGFRQLVDVATRALSPGINDPTTATQALDRLHDLLRRLVDRPFPSAHRVIDGRVRLVLRRPSWDDFLRLAIEEIRLAGAEQPQIVRRLRRLLDDLGAVAPDARLEAIRRERQSLEADGT